MKLKPKQNWLQKKCLTKLKNNEIKVIKIKFSTLKRYNKNET